VRKLDGLPKTRAITDENGLLTSEARAAQDELESLIPSSGDGTPENRVAAPAGAAYYDLSADTGSIIYIKCLNDIDGDNTRGWKLA
jgi:hypothetical protein